VVFLNKPLLLLIGLLLVGHPRFAEALDPLLQDPQMRDWQSLTQYSRTLSREEFEARLRTVFDPAGGLAPFLLITNESVRILSAPRGSELSRIEFAPSPGAARKPPVSFRQPTEFRNNGESRPLSGLRVVIEPADIGGKWGDWDDRSTLYRGYGRIQEGDLNLTVAKILRSRLKGLGATVFLTRETTEPVAEFNPANLESDTREVLAHHLYVMPPAYYERAGRLSKNSPQHFQVAKEVLFAKVLEQRARAEEVRRHFKPDITIVLQHDASPSSRGSRLTSVGRNIFFVSGAYTLQELRSDPHQRFRLLTKVFQNVTPVETQIAVPIANRFRATTGLRPVGYGNSRTTRSVIGGNAYVVARNLAFNREHDGPVVVTEPYFMNESTTLQRLLAGDYPGTRIVAGQARVSIYREYADCVAAGLVDAIRK
jgi:N-acetylmuramoyl-L-alanine amidase